MADVKENASASTRAFAERYDRHVTCTWCGSTQTRVSNPFGGTVSEILFECDACDNSFGWMKWEHREPESS